MLKKMVKSLVLLFLFAIVPAHAAKNKTLEGLEILRQGMSGMSDFSATIVQEKHLALMNEDLVARGVVRFKKPGLFYMELYSPYASRLLLKDNVLSYKLINEGVREKIALPQEENLQRWTSFLARPVIALPEEGNLTAERRGELWTLHFSPQGKKGIKAFHITFTGSGLLKKLEIEERNSDRTLIQLENMQRNVGLTDQDFTLE